MPFIRKLSALILLSVIFVFPSSIFAAEKNEVKLYEETYDTAKNLRCSIFIGGQITKDKPARVIVFLHGGSWIGGSRKQFYGLAKGVARQGFITVSMDYSLFKMNANVTMEDILDDIEHCVAYTKKRAGEMGYKTEKVALSGGSAGGHLALLYAYSRKKSCPLKVAFVFVQAAPTEFRLEKLITDPRQREQMKNSLIARALYGGVVPEDFFGSEAERKCLERLSPLSHIDRDTVPTIAAYGGKDNIIKRIHRDALQQKLNECGVTNVFIDFPNSGHGMNSDPEAARVYYQTVLRFAEKYF